MDLKREDDWHPHLTVEAPNRVNPHTFRETCERVGCSPTVIVDHPGNHPGGMLRARQNIIPSIECRAELGAAIVLLHDTAKFWAMTGWTVTRMKIEGRSPCLDALYCEAHVHVAGVRPPPLPLQTIVEAQLAEWRNQAKIEHVMTTATARPMPRGSTRGRQH